MRLRRPPPPNNPADAALVDFSAFCEQHDAPTSDLHEGTLDERRAAAGRRRAAWLDWCRARSDYAERHGWPGGEDARWWQEVRDAPPEPFDPLADL